MFGSLMEMNQLFSLNLFDYIGVTDGIVTRSDVIDQLFNILIFILARCYAINFVLVLDVNEPSG